MAYDKSRGYGARPEEWGLPEPAEPTNERNIPQELEKTVDSYRAALEILDRSFKSLESARTEHSMRMERASELQERICKLLQELQQSAPVGTAWRSGPRGPSNWTADMEGMSNAEIIKRLQAMR